tara:strand:+ start:4340 stop:5704 length:1365 start_codon:yes stop_codon:yes gene_type:complete
MEGLFYIAFWILGIAVVIYIIGYALVFAFYILVILFEIVKSLLRFIWYLVSFKWLKSSEGKDASHQKKSKQKTTSRQKKTKPEKKKVEQVKVPRSEKFKIKILKKNLDYKSSTYTTPSVNILAVGKIPKSQIHLGSYVSVIDMTSGKEEKVLSSIDSQQEDETACYLHKLDLAYQHTDAYFEDWTIIGKIVPEFMSFKDTSRKRKLKLCIRLFDWDNPPTIKNNKVIKGKNSIIWEANRSIDITIPKPEPIEEKDKAREKTIQIGVAVAMADGSLCSAEGHVIKEWVTKMIAPFGGKKRQELKVIYNRAFKNSYELANKGKLDYKKTANQLNDADIYSSKIETMELSYKVMAADGVIDSNEKKTIKSLAKILNINSEELDKIKEHIGSSELNPTASQILGELGIDHNLPIHQIRKKLGDSFMRYSNMYNIVPENEKEDIKIMMDKIAQVRNEYD